MTYGADFVEIYETVYKSRGKDWVREAEAVVALVRERYPHAGSLLDVACGTGAHLETFAQLVGDVEGLELSEPMLRRAWDRFPSRVHRGDMRNFRLPRRFDAVTCLFHAIGYVESREELHAAIQAMAEHLVPGGVLVVEPWWFPENFLDGYLAADAGHVEGSAIARVSHTSSQGRHSRLETRYLIARAEGIREVTQVHELMLFTRDEYLQAFDEAGCPATYYAEGINGRGTFVGVKGSSTETRPVRSRDGGASPEPSRTQASRQGEGQPS
jgi:SAM-dependent methyltransferase